MMHVIGVMPRVGGIDTLFSRGLDPCKKSFPKYSFASIQRS